MSTINRITGTNSGIDVDSVVKQSLSSQQNKIDKAYQQEKVYEYQQEQLKEIVTQSQEFYDKYLDILSGDSLLKSSAYESVSFTSTDAKGNVSTAVTAKGYAGADVAKYNVTVAQLATKATTKLTVSNFLTNGNIDPQKSQISIEMGEKKSGLINVVLNNGEIDMEATAKSLNSALKRNGINVAAKYSEIANGIVIESGDMGASASFGIDYTNSGKFALIKGQNAIGSIKKGKETYIINKESNTFSVDNIEFKLNSVTTDSIESDLTPIQSGADNTETTIEKTVKEDGHLTTTRTYDCGVSISKTDDGELEITGDLTALNIDGENGTDTKNGVTTKKQTVDGKVTLTTTKQIDIGGKKATIETILTTTKVNDVDTTETKTTTVKDEKGKNIFPKSDFLHLDVKDDVDYADKVTIKSLTTGTTTVKENGTTTTEQKESDGSSITTQIKSDGSIEITTQETGKSPVSKTISGAVKLSGKTDVSKLKDTIIKFVDDYNKLMTNINAKLWEKRDKSYMPLTESQKKEMSQSQIEEWEKKAKTGLLRDDSDLKRIQSSMKEAMSSMMSGTGLTLESIGIEPVDNYTTKNGTFKIDDNKLSNALQNNAEEVKDLFTRVAGDEKDKNGKIIDKGGVLTQLQSVLKTEIKSSSSALSKKIGFEGTATESSNTLKKNIDQKKSLIKQLQEQYETKETDLYKKYSNLEVMLEKLNSQTNSLYSMLGISQ